MKRLVFLICVMLYVLYNYVACSYKVKLISICILMTYLEISYTFIKDKFRLVSTVKFYAFVPAMHAIMRNVQYFSIDKQKCHQSCYFVNQVCYLGG